MGGVASKLRQDLVLIDADALHVRAKVADLLVEAIAEPEAPHRLSHLQLSPGGAPATDPRVARPPAASLGPVPEQVSGLVEDAYAQVGLVGLTAAGDWGSGPAAEVWACSRGWADLERNVPLGHGCCGTRSMSSATAGRAGFVGLADHASEHRAAPALC